MTVARTISVGSLDMAPEHLADWQVWRMTVAKMIFMWVLKMAPEYLAD